MLAQEPVYLPVGREPRIRESRRSRTVAYQAGHPPTPIWASHPLAQLRIASAISCYLMMQRIISLSMNISLGKQLEKLLQQQVKTGIYQNSSEVVRDALRHMFLEDDSDDTELLAQSLRAARNSPRKRYVRGEFQKLIASAVSAKRRRAKAA